MQLRTGTFGKVGLHFKQIIIEHFHGPFPIQYSNEANEILIMLIQYPLWISNMQFISVYMTAGVRFVDGGHHVTSVTKMLTF